MIHRRTLIKVGAALIAAPALLISKPARAGAFVGCILKNTVDSAPTNFAPIVITWSAEDADTDGFHSTSSNTGRITIPSAVNGRYGIFSCSVQLTSVSGVPTMQLGLQVNGTTNGSALGNWVSGSNSVAYICISSAPTLLNTADFWEVTLFCSDTTTVLTAGVSNFSLNVVG